MARYLSARHILSLAKVVEAVHAGRKIRFVEGDGEVVEGTLRGFTNHNGGMSFAESDLRDSHVRITTVQGPDIWIETEELAGLYEEGALSL